LKTHLEKLIPLNFETHVYFKGNLIRVFLIHLHSAHHNVILKELFHLYTGNIMNLFNKIPESLNETSLG
jgi:hypothetical protein